MAPTRSPRASACDQFGLQFFGLGRLGLEANHRHRRLAGHQQRQRIAALLLQLLCHRSPRRFAYAHRRHFLAYIRDFDPCFPIGLFAVHEDHRDRLGNLVDRRQATPANRVCLDRESGNHCGAQCLLPRPACRRACPRAGRQIVRRQQTPSRSHRHCRCRLENLSTSTDNSGVCGSTNADIARNRTRCSKSKRLTSGQFPQQLGLGVGVASPNRTGQQPRKHGRFVRIRSSQRLEF